MCYKKRVKKIRNAAEDKIHRKYVHSVVVYQRYLTRLGELIFVEPWRFYLSLNVSFVDVH